MLITKRIRAVNEMAYLDSDIREAEIDEAAGEHITMDAPHD